MRTLLLSFLLTSAAHAQSDPEWIFGMHDPGGEGHMADMGKKGWILFTEEIGREPWNTSGKDFTPWSSQGYGVIVRINHGYGPWNGTLPYDYHYDDFAQRVANYVAASPGSHIWVIGNETNLTVEWPRYEGWEQPITAAMYVSCFKKCRAKIKALPGHAGDQVCMQGVATWAAVIGQGWVEYHLEILNSLGSGGLDGIAVHTYTHGSDPNLIFSEAKMNWPYDNRHYNFRAYRDYLQSHPSWAKSLPVYITETDQNDPWLDANNGWVRNAYGEINSWNQTPGTQKIRALCLYRWPNADQWGFESKWGVIQDFKEAMLNDYKWVTVALPDVVVTSLSYANGVFTCTVKNQGPAPTPSGVAVGVGYHVDGVYKTWGSMVGPVAPGASVTIGTWGGGYQIPAGTHTITAVVDDINRFAESNESNNSYSKTVSIGATVSLKAMRVTTSTLNVRSGPGTGYSILGTISLNQIYVSDAVSNGWHRIWFGPGQGWCYGGYLAQVSSTAVKVVATVNVRTGPGTEYSILGQSPPGEHWARVAVSGGWSRIYWKGKVCWIWTQNTVAISL